MEYGLYEDPMRQEAYFYMLPYKALGWVREVQTTGVLRVFVPFLHL